MSPAQGAAARARRPLNRLVLLVATLLAGVLIYGSPYYGLPMAERVRHPLHPWLRASGYVGQSAGLIALAFFLFLWLYPVRKRFRWLAFTGGIARWLDVHVAAALVLPLLVTVHAGWRFGGLIGLGFWAMMVVWSSGLIGRYIYARIPRSRAGVELNRDEIAAERQRLIERIAADAGLDPTVVERTLAVDPPPGGASSWATLHHMIADDLGRRRAAKKLRRLMVGKRRASPVADPQTITKTIRLARQEMALTQHARMLGATHDLFRYWHVLHRPVAVAALIAVLIHVTVVVVMGATWLW